MKSFKNKFYIGILAAFLCTGSCQDDKFLEQLPETIYTTENIFSTAAQVDQIITGIYSRVKDLWVNVAVGQDYINFKMRGTDVLSGSTGQRRQFGDYSAINADNGTFNEIYRYFYEVVARTNLAIYAAELPQMSWTSESEKAYALAQARFFRAFMYKNLAELWGGVPIVNEVATEPRYDYVRASRVETYQFAIDDLEAILNDLPETTTQGGRIVRGAAQHNLCELYLAKGTQLEQEGDAGAAKADYAKAITYANQVIDGGLYSLMTERFGARKDEQTISIDIHIDGIITKDIVGHIVMETNHYWDLFQDGSVNYQDGNRECIWAFQIDIESLRAGDNQSILPYTQAYGPCIRNFTGQDIQGMLEDIGGRPNSNTAQTWLVRDLIWKDKWGDDLRNSEVVFRRNLYGNAEPTDANPRPYYLKIIPWDYIYYGSDDATTNVNNQSVCFPLSCKVTTDKYVTTDGQDRRRLFRDDYAIRLPETILLRAEAKQRNGDKAGAAADINLLRNRAHCSYLVTAADVDDKFDLILDERARELLYEECRWNTLLRMGGTIAVDRIRRYAFWPETATTLNFDYNLWPIPQPVIDVNKDVPMAQNPGWTNR